MVVDGLAIVVGSCLGTSPLTVFAESSVGIREGGTTGLTSLVIAMGECLSGGEGRGGEGRRKRTKGVSGHTRLSKPSLYSVIMPLGIAMAVV